MILFVILFWARVEALPKRFVPKNIIFFVNYLLLYYFCYFFGPVWSSPKAFCAKKYNIFCIFYYDIRYRAHSHWRSSYPAYHRGAGRWLWRCRPRRTVPVRAQTSSYPDFVLLSIVLPRRPPRHRPIVLPQTSSYRPTCTPDIVLSSYPRHRPIVLFVKQWSSYRPTMMWNRPIVLPKTTFFVGSRSSYRPTLIVHPYRPIVLPHRPIVLFLKTYRPIVLSPENHIVLSSYLPPT